MCYCEQLTVVGRLLCRKVMVRVLAGDNVAVLLKTASMFLVEQGIIFSYFSAFYLSYN